jgi:hypothetical protein
MQTGNEAEAVWEELRDPVEPAPGRGGGPGPPPDLRLRAGAGRAAVPHRRRDRRGYPAAAGVLRLSQAGQAIAAAATATGPDGWELDGHGINCVAQTLRDPLPEVRVQAGKEGTAGSFVRLSQLLDSPLWPKDEPLALSLL